MTTDTSDAVTPPAQPHITLTVPVLDWGERKAIRDKAARLHEELQAALKPEVFRMVFEYAEACRADEQVGETNMMWAMVDALAAHLPGQAAALRCLAQHVLESDFGYSNGCDVVTPERPVGGLERS